MRFDLDGLEVFFPYERMYLEQYQYMKSIKQAIDAHGHALLEMPTGTGKTVCLLSLISSYQYARPSIGKLVYCTRTVPEMNSVMEELGRVLAYRAQELGIDAGDSTDTNNDVQHRSSTSDVMDIEDTTSSGNSRSIHFNKNTSQNITSQTNTEQDENSTKSNKRQRRVYKRKIVKDTNKPDEITMGPITNNGNGAGGNGVLALCLSSRRNMCIHDRVIRESDREAVDAACRSMTASWVLDRAAQQPGSVETCSYYDAFQAAGEATSLPSGIYDLEQLKIWGKRRGWCPYYLTRQAINHANILVFNYQYMLDPKVHMCWKQHEEN